MPANLTLTQDEYKNLNNAFCLLYSLQRQLDGVVDSSLTADLDRALDFMDIGCLSRIRSEIQKENEERRSYYADLKKQLQFRSSWSNYAVPAGKMDDVAYQGDFTVHYPEYSEHKDVSPITAKLFLRNPTWLQLWKASDTLIKNSGDDHHTFIERFERNGNELHLVTGS